MPLILLADWIISTVFNFVIFYLIGLLAIPFILLFDLSAVPRAEEGCRLDPVHECLEFCQVVEGRLNSDRRRVAHDELQREDVPDIQHGELRYDGLRRQGQGAH